MRMPQDAQKFLDERMEALGLPPIRTTEEVIAESWRSVGNSMRTTMAQVHREIATADSQRQSRRYTGQPIWSR